MNDTVAKEVGTKAQNLIVIALLFQRLQHDYQFRGRPGISSRRKGHVA